MAQDEKGKQEVNGMVIKQFKRPRLLYACPEGEGLAVEVMYEGKRYGTIIPKIRHSSLIRKR